MTVSLPEGSAERTATTVEYANDAIAADSTKHFAVLLLSTDDPIERPYVGGPGGIASENSGPITVEILPPPSWPDPSFQETPVLTVETINGAWWSKSTSQRVVQLWNFLPAGHIRPVLSCIQQMGCAPIALACEVTQSLQQTSTNPHRGVGGHLERGLRRQRNHTISGLVALN